MNMPKKTDFIQEVIPLDAHLVAPDIHEPYQDTEEDFLHEKHLKEVEAQINERLGATSEDDLGELPFDEEADRKRWDELEKDFDRVFDEAKKQ